MTRKPGYKTLTKAEAIRALYILDEQLDDAKAAVQRLLKQLDDQKKTKDFFHGKKKK